MYLTLFLIIVVATMLSNALWLLIQTTIELKNDEVNDDHMLTMMSNEIHELRMTISDPKLLEKEQAIQCENNRHKRAIEFLKGEAS